MKLIRKHGTVVERLDPDDEAALLGRGDAARLATLFTRMALLGYWLLCDCGVDYHIRRRAIVARNPRRLQPEGTPCGLCERHPYLGPGGMRLGVPASVDLTEPMIRGIQRKPRLSIGGDPRPRTSTRSARERHAGALGRLARYLDAAGFNGLPEPLPSTDVWQRLADVLAAYPLASEDPTGMTFADFTALPGGPTPDELFEPMSQRWDAPFPPQVSVMGTVSRRPKSHNRIVRIELDWTERPLVIEIPEQRFYRGRSTGPWMLLGSATRDETGNLDYREVVLQAIAGENNPVPVESSFERYAALLLQNLRVPFYKPMWPLVDDLRPDFLLPTRKVMLEIQGTEEEGYDERKKGVHERMIEHAAFSGWKLITFDARVQPMGRLRRLIEGWWRSGVGAWNGNEPR